MAKIELRNVSKVYPGDVRALDDLSLAVEDGEFLVLVGPSGCGKSTALRLVAGLEDATAGEILADGELLNELTPQQRNVAMVFQNYALYPHKTVRQNLEFPLRMMKLSRAEIGRRVAEASRLLGLDEFIILAAQTAGGAIGSTFAPAKVIVGASTVGLGGVEGPVLKKVMIYGIVLVLIIGLATSLAIRGVG